MGTVIYLARCQSVSDEKRRDRDLHIERVCGSVFTFTFNIFPNRLDTRCVVAFFCRYTANTSCQLAFRDAVLPIVHGIIYELRAKRESYRKPNGIIDTADNRRFITHRNGYKMMSIGKKK